MNAKEIIESLCNHEISKQEAIENIRTITDGLRKKSAIEFQVISVSFTIDDDHGILTLKLPYKYEKIKGMVKKGDLVDVILLP